MSKKAKADLEAIWLYGLSEWSLQQADRYTVELYSVFMDIAATPGMGRPADFMRKGYRRFEHQSHVIFYKKRKADIFIVRVLHARMDPARHL